ncbi:group II intron maturase-specific domain-containing protein [Streptosporangium roseum]|uniref:group II intron maturase-specific domain-containing protein n=1 Tax=Streptosporangium roseum TaxID=2001 RepID=UPI0018CC53B5|nr:group II intron maturase-specific domain-containing protein [Streptosporangium roseum]
MYCKDANRRQNHDVTEFTFLGFTFRPRTARTGNGGLFVSFHGWMRYYGAFNRTALHPLLERINSYLLRWIRKKYRRLRTVKKALRAYQSAVRAYPVMFRHWRWTPHAWRTG